MQKGDRRRDWKKERIIGKQKEKGKQKGKQKERRKEKGKQIEKGKQSAKIVERIERKYCKSRGQQKAVERMFYG